MPIYVYECVDCGARKELLRPRDHREDPESCPSCGAQMVPRTVVPFNWGRGKDWGIYMNRPGYAKEE